MDYTPLSSGLHPHSVPSALSNEFTLKTAFYTRTGISLLQLQDLGQLIKTVLSARGVQIEDRTGKPQTWSIVNLYVINKYFVEPLTWKELGRLMGCIIQQQVANRPTPYRAPKWEIREILFSHFGAL